MIIRNRILSLLILIFISFTGKAAYCSVNFPDSNLETAIREELGKPIGAITDADMKSLTILDAGFFSIQDLTGIERATNLEQLYLDDNEISNLTPLANLTNLLELDLSMNRISDISALNNLTELIVLILFENQITDITPLANLTTLEILDLADNRISTISPLSGLTCLTELYLEDNRINDISPLVNLTSLTFLYLEENEINDISPLVTNSAAGGLGPGDYVDLTYNLLDLTEGSTNMADIQTLISNGVEVDFEPQKTTVVYTVSLSVNPSAGGRTTGEGQYMQDASATVTAIANSGYTFINWTENGTVVSTSAEFAFTVTQNRTLVANFEQDIASYAISVSANPTAGGNVTGGGTYSDGTSVTVTAISNSGYTFINWMENGTIVSASAEFTFTVTRNRILVANFEELKPGQFSVTVSATPPGSGNVTGGGSYAPGTSVTVRATPHSGFIFKNWTEAGSIVSTGLSYTFTITQHRTLVANFQKSTSEAVDIADPNLESALRTSLNILSGDIKVEDMETLTTFRASGRRIETLSGLEYAVNLTQLYLSDNQIEEISPLSQLVKLEILYLWGNPFTDISPLGNLTRLEKLYLYDNNIQDLSALSTLVNLVELSAGGNQVQDITPLTRLSALQRLYLSYNQISDISAIGSLTNLIWLSLAGNHISDISPLVTNSAAGGLGAGDYVDLRHNLLDLSSGSANMSDIGTLSGKGVTVVYKPQQTGKIMISLDAQPPEGGSVFGGGEYDAGQFITITATATSGYTFRNWTENGIVISSSPSHSLEVLSDSLIIANFEKSLPCAAVYLLGNDDPRLDILRQYRDETLSGSAFGMTLIDIYYDRSADVIRLSETSPFAKQMFRTMLEALIPAVQAAPQHLLSAG